MADDWIRSATSKNKGKFGEKAAKAGMSTRAYAAKESGAPGKLGKEAREAQVFERMAQRRFHKHGGK